MRDTDHQHNQPTAAGGTVPEPTAVVRPTVQLSLWPAAGMVFSLVALALLLMGAESPTVQTLTITFVSIVLEAMPFMMLGALVGGFIEVFVSRDRIAAILPRKPWAAIAVAGLLGVIFPVCECAIIPVVRRLLRKGVPFSAAVAYLLAGPIVNPIVAASTAVAYAWDWSVVATRLIAGYGVAVFVALMMHELFGGNRALLASNNTHTHDHDGCCGHDHEHEAHAQDGTEPTTSTRVSRAFAHAADEFLAVTKYLIIGAFIAAVAQTLIARETFVALASTPALAIPLMMVMAVVLNLCSESDAFVAASFRTTLPISAQMAFMVLGPMLDLKLIAMYLSFVRKRALAAMIVMICGMVFFLMMILQATNV